MPFSCTECDYRSYQLYELEHTSEFESNYVLNNDMKNLSYEMLHTGEKPCFLCKLDKQVHIVDIYFFYEKEINTNMDGQYDDHMRVHTGKNIFLCLIGTLRTFYSAKS